MSPAELKLVGTRAFRRLRNIKQLALTYLVYPGAMHTRFEHSLGVMELATRAFDAVCRGSHEKLTENFKKMGMGLDEAKTLLRATALLHDVGHLPFSHAGEGLLPKKANGKPTTHEEVSIAIIRGEEISAILNSEFYPGIAAHITLLLGETTEGLPPELLILKKLISGQFDADRMDYLSRDSLHCGVGYGNFDYLRLLETLQAKDSSEGGLELSAERGGVHTLEAMVLARYWMFTQVYCHKTRRIYDIYLSRYLDAWSGNRFQSPLDVMNEDDLSVMYAMIQDADSGTGERQRYARRILNRDHHRVVYETDHHADIKARKIAIEVERKLRQRFPDCDFILDREARGTIHKFYVKGDEEAGDEFPIFDTVSKKYSALSEESGIFQTIPKTFHVIRIYGDVPKKSLPAYRESAAQIAKELKEAV